MIRTPTVFVLGAGASAPYGFDTGGLLLEKARALNADQIAAHIKPFQPSGANPLHDALVHTGDLSIDAMLESRGDLQVPGKALIARLLLQQERQAKARQHTSSHGWYRTLFSAMEAPTPAEAVAQPVRFVTFNYDRSLEYCLSHAWRVKFRPDQSVDLAPVRQMFIHLHGQLGFLPEIGGDGPIVPYGGSESEISDTDIQHAAKAIKIVSEAHPAEPQFVLAREAIANAARVIFLGFGFAPRNVERLQVHLMRRQVQLYVSTSGMSPNQTAMLVHSWAASFSGKTIGQETQDALEFLRCNPQALS